MVELYTAVLSDWELLSYHGVPRLKGKISEDIKERFADGTVIFTSAVKRINFGTMIAVTDSGSLYKLSDSNNLPSIG
jgi:hypothetical protein